MFNLTFSTPITELANIAEFNNDIMQVLFNQRIHKEKHYLVGNTTYELVIVATILLCVMIKLDISRGSEKTYDEFSELYKFSQIEHSLNLQGLSLNDFFEYCNLFTS